MAAAACPPHGFVGVTRLHESGRLVLFRQDKGDEGYEDGAADDDAADDFPVCFCDLPELADVDVLMVFMLFEHSHFPGGSQLLFRIGIWIYQ